MAEEIQREALVGAWKWTTPEGQDGSPHSAAVATDLSRCASAAAVRRGCLQESPKGISVIYGLVESSVQFQETMACAADVPVHYLDPSYTDARTQSTEPRPLPLFPSRSRSCSPPPPQAVAAAARRATASSTRSSPKSTGWAPARTSSLSVPRTVRKFWTRTSCALGGLYQLVYIPLPSRASRVSIFGVAFYTLS